MDVKMENLNKLSDEVADNGIWVLNRSKVQSAADDFLDLIMTNVESCGIFNVAHDIELWCGEHPGTCTYGENIDHRLIYNAKPLLKDFLTLFKLAMDDQKCTTDEEDIASISQVMIAVGHMMRVVVGFEGVQWDQTIEINQKVMDDLDLKLQKANKEYNHK